MEQNLTDEEKTKVLLYYLKDFAIYFDDTEEKLFNEKLQQPENAVIYSSDYSLLKKAMCYLLLKAEKRVNYYFLKSNDVLDKMLKDNDDPENEDYTFRDLSEVQLLIIYHPRVWKRNKILWETLNFLLETRKVADKTTIIITDSYKLSDDHGSLLCDNFINLDGDTDITGIVFQSTSNASQSIYDD